MKEEPGQHERTGDEKGRHGTHAVLGFLDAEHDEQQARGRQDRAERVERTAWVS